jgi:hypothetical protein
MVAKKIKKLPRDYTKVLIRHDIHEHLIKMYLLYERTNTYVPNTEGFQPFTLYHLANQDTEHSKKERTNAYTDVEGGMYLHGLNGTEWMEMAERVLQNMEKDLDSKRRAGLILVELVARFGTGILLTCAVNVYQS